jgi:RNA polymerase sigma-70 factor (ECF subfamily)
LSLAVTADPAPEGLGSLVTRAQRGEVASFEALYRAHVGRVHGLCRRLVGDWHLAEELTQDVFVRAWRRLPSFRGEAAFGTWLYRIAVNRVIEERRTRARRQDREEALDEAFDVPAAPAAAPERTLDLERAIAALPPGARTVFVLHDVEGWEHAEIAAAVGVAVGTSKAQLHRARLLLQGVVRP